MSKIYKWSDSMLAVLLLLSLVGSPLCLQLCQLGAQNDTVVDHACCSQGDSNPSTSDASDNESCCSDQDGTWNVEDRFLNVGITKISLAHLQSPECLSKTDGPIQLKPHLCRDQINGPPLFLTQQVFRI